MKVILFLALCGFAAGLEQSRFRIVGNSVARYGEFPYLVSIQIDGRHTCGGSLITKKHVLTAAHCVDTFISSGMHTSRMKIAVGTNTVPGGTIYDVDRVAHHPSYIRKILRADVAVIRLKTEVRLSANVRTISLPRPGQALYENTRLDVGGFGTNYLNGPTSAILKMETMYSVSHANCQRYWQGHPLDGLFCGALAPGHGVCQGDSGGPVTVNKRVVMGIVSGTSGKGCGLGIPDLFTSVPYYLDFINSEIARTF